MENIDEKLITWAKERIERDFKDEVSLLLGRKGACKIETDEDTVALDFFIPATDKGYSFAKTFIIGDRGYDLFPMSWERVEGLAALDEGSVFCLADSEILYAKSETDREKFEILRRTLFNNLKNKDYIYKKALEKTNFAMDIFKTMIFEKNLCDLRKAAGGIFQNLSEGIAIINGTYIKGDYAFGKKIEQIKTFEKIPENYIDIYEEILKEEECENICRLVYKLLLEVREFLKKIKNNKLNISYNYDELASWYEESRYTFRRIEYACENNKYEEAFSWGCYLQIEFDILTEEAGLEKMDLLTSYNSRDLSNLKKRASEIEKYINKKIKEYGVTLRKYGNINEFLKYEV